MVVRLIDKAKGVIESIPVDELKMAVKFAETKLEELKGPGEVLHWTTNGEAYLCFIVDPDNYEETDFFAAIVAN